MKTSVILAVMTGCLTLHAQDSASSQDVQSTLRTDTSFWKDGIGNGFNKGTKEVGATVGFAPGGEIFGSQRTHEFILGAVDAGWVFSDVVAENSIFRGNWELLGELFGGKQISPHDAGLGGLDVFLRYDFATGTRLVPFIQGGAGVMITDIGTPDLSTAFQFNEKVGIGLQYFLTERWAVSLEVRFMHISNASIKSPNTGVNTFPILAGVSYLF